MKNPFRGIVKADELSPARAGKLFVHEASPIWRDLQHPINHIVVGPRGAGKTMALKQLDYRTPHNQQVTLPFVGLYIQISRISFIFKNLFDAVRHDLPVSVSGQYQRAFSDYLWLEIVRDIATFLRVNAADISSAAARALLLRMTGLDMGSVDDIHSYCASTHMKIEQQIQTWSVTRTCSWQPLGDLSASLQRTANGLPELFQHLSKDRPCLYLLFDSSAPIPEECQAVINVLLHRGRPYCAKLAVRPFEWSTLDTSSGTRIELDSDLAPLYIHYPNELEDDYVMRMRDVINRVLETEGLDSDPESGAMRDVIDRVPETEGLDSDPESGASGASAKVDIDTILAEDINLKYSGFRSICAASSGNPQNLILLCSSIFEAAIARKATTANIENFQIPAELQDEAVRAWSQDYEDHNPYAGARALCRALLRTIRESNERMPSIGFAYGQDTATLFTTDFLPEDVGDRIKPAFSGGFLRNTRPNVTSLFEAPARFHISRGLLPREGLDLNLPIQPELDLDRAFVVKHAKETPGGGPVEASTTQGDIPTFLSVSFSALMRQQRDDIKRVLKNVGIVCRDIIDVPENQFLFSTIYSEIKRAAITILDATILRPFTMFEVGLCAGAAKGKRVICIVNDDGDDDVIEKIFDPLKKLPIHTFSFSVDRQAQLAAEIGVLARDLISRPSEFTKVALTGSSLRPRRRRDKTAFVSLPDSSMRDRAIDEIRKRLGREGWDLISEEDVDLYTANEFQIPIQCAYMTRIGIIDTTGKDGPDLMQCYKLGLFPGKKNWRVLRTEQKPHARRETFSTVPNMEYFAWVTFEELADRVARFVTRQR